MNTSLTPSSDSTPVEDIGNILQATVQIEGTRPLLWNHLKPSEDFGQRQERSGTAGNDPTEWQRNVLMDENRQLYLLSTHIFGCVRDGAKYTKRGRSTLMTNVASTLQVVERRVMVDRIVPEDPIKTSEDSDESVYVFMSVVKNIVTRSRNIRYRVAASPGWSCSFRLCWDRTIVSRNEMEAIVRDAGRLVGLADGRTIGYGRFSVMDFSVQDH